MFGKALVFLEQVNMNILELSPGKIINNSLVLVA